MPGFKRWPVAFSAYPDDSTAAGIQLSVTPTTIVLGDDATSHTVSNYVNMSIDDIVAELNGNLSNWKIVRNLDIGAERITQSSLVSENVVEYLEPDNPLTCRYLGVVTRATERSVIQLKPPRPATGMEPWYGRIGQGKFRARFSDVNLQNYPGINANAIYEFGIKEFDIQEWSPEYGAPYKTIQGEIPDVLSYHAVAQSTILRVSRRPIFWHNKNISISFKGSYQSNAMIKHVDENNGLIYINQKIGKRSDVRVDYTFRETDYVYDAVDLNASIAHNPFVIDTYVAFYIKPVAAEGAIISGGRSVFHEIVTAEAAARTKVARIIPETLTSSNPLYEPIIYLGSLNVRQGTSYDDFDIIDTRTRGGGVYQDNSAMWPGNWREAEFFYDIGNIDGIDVPGNAAAVIKLPGTLTGQIPVDEIKERAQRDIALGVVPIFEFSTGAIV